MIRSNFGIGDILLLRLYTQNVEVNANYAFPLSMLKEYRENSSSYLQFIQQLLAKLWPLEYERKFVFAEKVHGPGCIQEYLQKFGTWSKVTNYDLSSYFQNACQTPIISECPYQYIVLNTKLRFENLSTTKCQEYKTIIKNSCLTAKFKSPVVILGEQYLEDNKEVKHHNMATCYDELIKLKENNTVIDRSTKTVNNCPSMDQFEQDINILHYSKASIHLGYGGSFCMSLVFASNCLAWTCGIDYPFHNFHSKQQFRAEQIQHLETFLQSITEL